MSAREKGLDYFQKLVSLIYREIGVLEPKHHSAVASKRKLENKFFGDQRKQKAKFIYQRTRQEHDTAKIADAYHDVTGLTLQDVNLAFATGNWDHSRGFGGKKWAAITKATLDLKQAIDASDNEAIENILLKIDSLEHNHGKIVKKFAELE